MQNSINQKMQSNILHFFRVLDTRFFLLISFENFFTLLTIKTFTAYRTFPPTERFPRALLCDYTGTLKIQSQGIKNKLNMLWNLLTVVGLVS